MIKRYIHFIMVLMLDSRLLSISDKYFVLLKLPLLILFFAIILSAASAVADEVPKMARSRRVKYVVEWRCCMLLRIMNPAEALSTTVGACCAYQGLPQPALVSNPGSVLRDAESSQIV